MSKHPLLSDGALARQVQARVRAGDYEGALRLTIPMTARNPDHPFAQYAAGLIAYQLHDSPSDKGQAIELATRHLERAAVMAPHLAEAHYNLGICYRHLGRHHEAYDRLVAASEMRPQLINAWTERGCVEAALGMTDEAHASLRRALSREPDTPEAGLAQSGAAMLLGQWERGWRLQDWRLRNPTLRILPTLPNHIRRWEGEPGTRLLVFGEQGFGDCIQMLRYLPQLRAMSNDVAVHLRAPLVPMVQAEWPDLTVMTGDDIPYERYSHVTALMSLPARLGVPTDGAPYMHRPPREIHTARRYAFAWAGSRSHRNDRLRSSPLTAWEPLLTMPGTEWIAFADGRESEMYEAGVPATVTLASGLSSWEATRQVLASVDAVVSVDTAIAHLAGAMGIPTYVLLSADADHRWGMQGRFTDWYNHWTLIRQPTLHNWRDTITLAREALNAGMR